ncbi:MAG: putative addiction module antidote protein [Kordiimonadaceae bacterium]|nr:putative addiction module antidote protein [Kordiimonadaceae bacterium]
MALKTTAFDPAEYLENEEDFADYLNSAFESGETAIIAEALGVIARAKGMTLVAKETELGRESLYKALSKQGNPEFATIIKVMTSLGMRLTAQPLP